MYVGMKAAADFKPNNSHWTQRNTVTKTTSLTSTTPTKIIEAEDHAGRNYQKEQTLAQIIHCFITTMTKTEEGSSPSGEAEQEPTDESKVGDNDGGETAEVKEPTGDVQEDGDKVKEDAEGVPPEGQTEENPATVVEKQPEEADVTDQAAVTAAGETSEKKEGEDENPVIWDPTEFDVLSGRGASVNAHGGNKKFRAYCFSRKPEFNAGNHAAKRRIATEIVNATLANGSGRFLKRKEDKGPWFEMTKDQAILKACQVMRDYKRPDRVAMREMMAQNGNARKRQRTQESTPMLEMVRYDCCLFHGLMG